MAERVREADAHSLKRWAAGRITFFNLLTLGYDVAAKGVAAV